MRGPRSTESAYISFLFFYMVVVHSCGNMIFIFFNLDPDVLQDSSSLVEVHILFLKLFLKYNILTLIWTEFSLLLHRFLVSS